MRKSVLFYSDWYEILRELPDDERVRAYDAIMQFAFEDIEPTDKYIKASYDYAINSYEKQLKELKNNE